MVKKWELRGIAATLMMVFLWITVPGTASGTALEIDDRSGTLGSQVVFTVSVNSAPNAVSSLGVDIGFDPSVLEYVSEDFTGTLVEGWSFKQVTNPAAGVLRLGAFTTVQEIAAGSSGSLVKITFKVIGQQDCSLPLSALKDDIAGWGTDPGQFTYSSSAVMLYVACGGGNCGGKQPCYHSIQEGISAAADGATIKIAQGTCDEDVILGEAKEIFLQGGWDSAFEHQSGFTTISGLAIRSGKIIVSNIVIAGTPPK